MVTDAPKTMAPPSIALIPPPNVATLSLTVTVLH
jgi:hypothetical protein